MTHDQCRMLYFSLLTLAERARQNILHMAEYIYMELPDASSTDLPEPESPDQYDDLGNLVRAGKRSWRHKIGKVVQTHVNSAEEDLLSLMDCIEMLRQQP